MKKAVTANGKGKSSAGRIETSGGKLTVVRKNLADLIPDAKNANKGTVRGRALLEDSLSEDGAGRGILLDKNMNVIAGNKTVETAFENGFDEVVIVPTDGKTLVATQRIDVEIDSAQGRRMAVRDNRVGQVDLDWNIEQLKEFGEKLDLDLSTMWFKDELPELFDSESSNSGNDGHPEAAIERAQEWLKKWKVKSGQLWQIDRHRLLCGDAYDQAEIDRLLDGRKADMLHIDPPYGIGIVWESNKSGKGSIRKRSSTAFIEHANLYPVMQNDDRPFDPTKYTNFASVVIMWGANYYADKLPTKSCWIVWDKRENLTRNNFADCEIAWTNQDSPARIFYHLWSGLYRGSQVGQARLHPTEKPVALYEEIGKTYAPSGLWLDLFAGSGSQFIAAQNTDATCYGIEIEPLYAATVIERLSEVGLKPKLVKS